MSNVLFTGTEVPVVATPQKPCCGKPGCVKAAQRLNAMVGLVEIPLGEIPTLAEAREETKEA